VVIDEFEWRADVDYFVEIGQPVERNKQVFQSAALKN
jgi:hypothetical protein